MRHGRLCPILSIHSFLAVWKQKPDLSESGVRLQLKESESWEPGEVCIIRFVTHLLRICISLCFGFPNLFEFAARFI